MLQVHGYWERSGLMTDYIAALILLTASLLALRKKENAYDLLLQGTAEGLKLLLTLIPGTSTTWV